jgi:hypothetical protein
VCPCIDNGDEKEVQSGVACPIYLNQTGEWGAEKNEIDLSSNAEERSSERDLDDAESESHA